MKKVVGLFLVVFGLAFLPAVHAEEKPAIAIIDTGVDTSQVNVYLVVYSVQTSTRSVMVKLN